MRFNDENVLNFKDIFSSAENLINRFDEYISYIQNNPLKEEKMYGTEGQVGDVRKMRIPTLQGFAYYLRVPTSAFKQYREIWPDHFCFIEDAFYAISIEGAAAGLLKESLVIRKLGLAEKIEENHTIRKYIMITNHDDGRAIEAEDAQILIE